MKKSVWLIIALLLCLTLVACGKVSEEAQAVIDKIDSIGKVTEDSGLAIAEAENAYSALTEEQRKQVKNFETLSKARTEYDEILLSFPMDIVKLGWNSTVEDMQEQLGKWDNKESIAGGGTTYYYSSYTYNDMKGSIQFTFSDNTTLTCATFLYRAKSVGELNKKFDAAYDAYASKYGTPDTVQENPIGNDSEINFYFWYRKEACVSISYEVMTLLPLYELSIRFIPAEE